METPFMYRCCHLPGERCIIDDATSPIANSRNADGQPRQCIVNKSVPIGTDRYQLLHINLVFSFICSRVSAKICIAAVTSRDIHYWHRWLSPAAADSPSGELPWIFLRISENPAYKVHVTIHFPKKCRNHLSMLIGAISREYTVNKYFRSIQLSFYLDTYYLFWMCLSFG